MNAKSTYAEISQVASEHGVDRHWAVAKRIVYLKNEIVVRESQIAKYRNKTYPEGSVGEAFIKLQCTTLEKEIRRFRLSLKRLRAQESGKNDSKGQIDEAMIQRAKDTLIEEVVEFDHHGKALAFCHEDSNPSLHWNKRANRAHCFPCGKSFNAVDVLIERDGLTFVQAVKELNL